MSETEYERQTDQVHQIKLASCITDAHWKQKFAAPGDTGQILVQTHFVGDGSDIEIKIEDMDGKKQGQLKGRVFGDQYAATVRVPEKVKGALVFTAKLAGHGLERKSNQLIITPRILATNLQWSQTKVKRKEIVTLKAEVENVPDGEQVAIRIYEYDPDGIHDFITRFTVKPKNKKIDVEWEFDYHQDTSKIPTQKEMEKYGKNYSAPRYFFTVDCRGQVSGSAQESGLMEFTDEISFGLKSADGEPLEETEYVISYADGTSASGKLDADGQARLTDVPPGPYEIDFPAVPEFESV